MIAAKLEQLIRSTTQVQTLLVYVVITLIVIVISLVVSLWR